MIYTIGGKTKVGENWEYHTDILIYEDSENVWTKVGDLCHGRAYHGMSLVHADLTDECILDLDC